MKFSRKLSAVCCASLRRVIVLSFLIAVIFLVNNVAKTTKVDLDLFLEEDQNFIQNQEDASSNSNTNVVQKLEAAGWAQWWSYDGISGPDYWRMNKRWSLCSLGRKQSPIDLRTSRLVYDHLLTPIRFHWLHAGLTNPDQSLPEAAEHKPIKVQLFNSGRGLEVWLEGGPGGGSNSEKASDQLILSQGPLGYAYKLFKIELHASGGVGSLLDARLPTSRNLSEAAKSGNARNDDDQKQDNNQADSVEDSVPGELPMVKSSEHLIDGRAFDGELQLYFYNKHLLPAGYKASELDLEQHPWLIAAVSVFIIAQRRNATYSNDGEEDIVAPNTGSVLELLLDNLEHLQNQGNSRELSVSRSQLMELIPDREQYVTYQGSFSKPPCTENVDWILLNKPLKVDRDRFRGLFDKVTTGQDNVRPVRPLHKRILRTTISKQSLGFELNNQCVGGAEKPNCGRINNRQYNMADKCNMRPRYAYQLTPNQLDTKT